MNYIRKILGVLVLSSLLVSCSEEELLLLDKNPMFEDDGSPRNIARPEDIVVKGELNRNIKIIWPEVSKSITSAKVIISRSDFRKEIIVTDFTKDIDFQADDAVEYDVEISYNSKDILESKSRKYKVHPGDYEVDIMGQEMQVIPLAGKIKFEFKKYLLNDYSYTIKYKYDNKEYVKEYLSSSDTLDSYIIDGLNDDLFPYNFEVKIVDKKLNIESSNYSKTINSLPLPHVIIERNLGVVDRFDGALLSWTNISTEAAKVIVKYVKDGVTIVKSKTSDLRVDTMSVDGINSATSIEYYTESLDGVKTVSRFYTVNPAQLITFNTKALKADAGWTAVVSSSQSGDGSGASALLDGLGNTYWHTQYSPELKFPHHATVTLPSEHKFTKVILTIRDHGTANPFKDFEVQVSEDGKTFKTQQAFTNTVNVRASVVTFDLDKPIISRYVRILFTSSLPGNFAGATAQPFMQLAELSFVGYK